MRTIPATKASRAFSALLDAVERGESFTITRGGKQIAEVTPVIRHTLGDFARAIEQIGPCEEWDSSPIEVRAWANSLPRRDPWEDN